MRTYIYIYIHIHTHIHIYIYMYLFIIFILYLYIFLIIFILIFIFYNTVLYNISNIIVYYSTCVFYGCAPLHPPFHVVMFPL